MEGRNYGRCGIKPRILFPGWPRKLHGSRMDRLAGKTAIVSGGARGIGQAIAQMFAEEGAWVLILDTDSDAEETMDSIRGGGGEGMFCQADVSDEAAVASAVKLAAAERNG